LSAKRFIFNPFVPNTCGKAAATPPVEVSDALTAEHPTINSCTVEASGWDSAHTFFVENCELEGNEETGKYLTLTHAPRRGSMIFLRILQPTSPGRSSPVAYRAQPIGVTHKGQQQFRLKQVRPHRVSTDQA